MTEIVRQTVESLSLQLEFLKKIEPTDILHEDGLAHEIGKVEQLLSFWKQHLTYLEKVDAITVELLKL